MKGESMHESRLLALERRLACYCFACENASLARLAAHTWRHLWFFSGHPNFRTGSLCFDPYAYRGYSVRGVRLVCNGDLNASGFCARLTGVYRGAESMEGKFGSAAGLRKLPNILAMECILCGDPDRLAALDIPLLEAEAASLFDSVNAFQYAAALGSVDCFTVLIDKLGVTSPLLVDAHGKLNSGVLACCDARFPFGHREGMLHLLLSRLSWDCFLPNSLLESASLFGAAWMLSFVFVRFAEAEKKRGTTASVELGPFLLIACRNGHFDCARLLLEHGADVNARGQNGWTALMYASQNGSTDCARMLLDHGADANAKRDKEQTALMAAAHNGRTDCALLLLEHGADVNAADDFGQTALMFASRNGHLDCARMLLEHGADANGTAVMSASFEGRVDCVRLLLGHGADVNARGQSGRTALMSASLGGHTDCVRFLLEHGADANVKNSYGQTSLMLASFRGHADCVRVLLEHGADVNAKANLGRTALMLASENGQTDIVRLLKEHGASC